jgi:SAM-dependent methyltransferase
MKDKTKINPNNEYTSMQKGRYHGGTSNHEEHNNNPDYWYILLKEAIEHFDNRDIKVLDFGCGAGRNVENIINKFEVLNVDGVDISETNIQNCKKNLPERRFFRNNGVDLQEPLIESNYYDLVISTIVFQHIPVWDIRMSLMSEIFRVLNKGGLFSLQMGYGGSDNYKENHYEARSTNGNFDVCMASSAPLIKDLKDIGFHSMTFKIQPSFSDNQHPEWIYVKAHK